VIPWDEFVRTLRARIAVPAKEESLELVKDEEEEQRDEETDPVATTYHEQREEKKSTDDAHHTLISATEPDEDTTPIQNSDPDEVEKRDKIIPRPDPIEDTTNPAKEPAEDPNHAKITAADPVDDAYHLFDEIPPRISESFLERPFPDPAMPNVIILEAINHTVSSLVPQNSYEDGVYFFFLKHRWRWKEEEDAMRAGRGRRHCCRRSRARQGTGGPRSRARGRRLGPVPMLFSVGSRSCRERRVVRVDDEGQFWAVHFTPKQTDRWHPHELFLKMKDSWSPFHFKAEGGFSFFFSLTHEDGLSFASRRLWILQWAGSCAWAHLHGKPVLHIL
jgi:hypothetical protein